MALKSLTTFSSLFIYLFIPSNQFIYHKKIRGFCLMSLNWCRFLDVHVLFERNGVSFILSCFFQYNTSAMRNEFWVEVYYETRKAKLSNFLWFLKYETSDTTNR